MVTIKLKYNFVETPRKFVIAELSIRKLGSSSVLYYNCIIISTDEDPSLRTGSSAMINLRGVSTKLYFRVSSRPSRQSSIVDGLLTEIYDRYHHGSRSGDSDNVTECSTTSFYSGSFELDERTQRWSRSQLNGKGELYNITLMLILDGLFSLLFIVFEFHLV